MTMYKNEVFHRSASFKRESIDEEKRTAELAFSSEEPVERYFGDEVLVHTAEAIRLGRLADGGPVLVDHDPSDHVGVVESVTISDDRRGRALVRFGRSVRADEIFKDVVDGIRKSVSVGYRIHAVDVEKRKGAADLVRVTDWEPFEISLVSVPADASVGIGRNQNLIKSDEVVKMTDEVKNPAAPVVDTMAIENSAREAERSRVKELLETGEAFKAVDLARKFVSEGGTVSDLNKAILARMGTTKPVSANSPEIGLTEREAKNFSFVRAINALANPTDRRAREAASFEFECSEAAAQRSRRESRGILIPVDVLKRDLTVGTATAGGHTVSTDLLTGNFIDLLRNRSVMMQMATLLTDLNGNIAIPRMTGGATAYWVGEGSAPTESQQAFDQVTLSPNTVGAYTEMSRKLLLQSSMDIEALVRRDLATVLGLEIDRVAIEGSGSGAEPTGILNVSGIGAVAGGTNGLAPAWSHIVNLETEVTTDNADVGTLRYLTNAKVCGKLKQTEKASGTAQFVWDNGTLNGYQAIVSNQVPSDLTKGTSSGVCSAIIFGNFADLLIGMWGGLDLQVNPYSLDTTGGVRITAFQDIDLAVRHPESFAAMKDALTT